MPWLRIAASVFAFMLAQLFGTLALSMLPGFGLVASVLAFVLAVLAARWVWRVSANPDATVLRSTVLGAVVVGGIGFAGGFFGPLIFAPDANQGPLLGIFITGPIGFALGAVGGFFHGVRATGRG
jgi:hypothetical protein